MSRCLGLGAAAFLPKPLRLSELQLLWQYTAVHRGALLASEVPTSSVCAAKETAAANVPDSSTVIEKMKTHGNANLTLKSITKWCIEKATPIQVRHSNVVGWYNADCIAVLDCRY